MSETPILPGAVVRLKSGGPEMTIASIRGGSHSDHATCYWWSTYSSKSVSPKYCCQEFPLDAVEVVEKEPKKAQSTSATISKIHSVIGYVTRMPNNLLSPGDVFTAVTKGNEITFQVKSVGSGTLCQGQLTETRYHAVLQSQGWFVVESDLLNKGVKICSKCVSLDSRFGLLTVLLIDDSQELDLPYLAREGGAR